MPTVAFTRSLLLAVSLLLTSLCVAQMEVSGRVTSKSGEPLAGVNIYCPSTFEGATTDSLGQFSFTAFAKTPFILQTQYIGYRVDSITVTEGLEDELVFKLRETATALSEVVVTAGAFVASDTRKTAVLSSIDVATTGATADLAEALSTLPGSTPAGESGQLLVRGGNAAETQAYINGMRVPKLYSSALPDVPSRTRFSPFAFKGITFASGGFSAQYGDALSGALILQTQGIPEKNLTSVSLMTLGAQVGRAQRIGDNQGFAISANINHMGAYTTLNKVAAKKVTQAPQGGGLELGYWWEGRDGRNLKVFSQLSTQRYAGQDSLEAKFYGANSLGLNNKNSYTQAVYQQPVKATGLLEVGAAIGTNSDAINLDGNMIDLIQVDYQARANYSDNFKDLALWRIGAEHQLRSERVDRTIPELTRVASLDRQYTASFAEADWFLASSWVLRTGLRYDNYDGQHQSLSPRLQLSHLFSPSHQLALSLGNYRQRQTQEDLFAVAHGLRPADLKHLGITYSKSWSGRVLRAEAYAKQYDNLVTNNGTALQTEGIGHARGFDFFFRDRKTVKNADFWVSYSLTDAARKRGTLAEKAPVPFAAQHNVAVVAKRFFAKPGFGVSATYRFHSGRPFDNPNSAVRFGGLTPKFHDLSANVTYLTNVKGHFTVIFVSMSNVAGAKQIHQYRYAQEPAENGQYERLAVRSLFPRFPFAGMFISIGDKNRQGSVDDI